MMTATPLTSVSQAGSYYEIDDYYTRESAGEHQALSQWYGKGAAALGLSGPIKPQDFQAMLNGELPSGERLGRMVKGERQHRPGWDFTLSPPKSVSLMIELGGDKRLLEAHNRAVKDTFDMMEGRCAYTRTSQGGKADLGKVSGMTAAFFLHNTNRDQKPQIHTHWVVMNAVQRDDGQWRSFEAKPWFEHKMMGGQYYRAQMAAYIMDLGYEVKRTGRGFFEIAGIPRELIERFSGHRKAVTDYMARNGLPETKAAEIAALATRRTKDLVGDRDILRDEWRATLGKDQPLLDGLLADSHTRLKTLESESDPSTAQPADWMSSRRRF